MPDARQPRSAILNRTRLALGASANDAERRNAVEERIAARKRGTLPTRTEGDAATLKAQLITMLESAAASVAVIDTPDDLPAAVADYLKEQNLPAAIRCGSDPLLGEAPWASVPTLEVNSGAAVDADQTGLAVAFAAAAETGTLVLMSGPGNPVTLNFLPETHIVVVPASCIHGAYEEAWDSVRDRYGNGSLPRTINLVTGPSRTGDIEQTILLGAHGPRRLHVIVVDGK